MVLLAQGGALPPHTRRIILVGVTVGLASSCSSSSSSCSSSSSSSCSSSSCSSSSSSCGGGYVQPTVRVVASWAPGRGWVGGDERAATSNDFVN